MKKYSPLGLIVLLAVFFFHVIVSTDYSIASAALMSSSATPELSNTDMMTVGVESSWVTTWVVRSPTLYDLHWLYTVSYWATFAMLMVCIVWVLGEYYGEHKLQRK